MIISLNSNVPRYALASFESEFMVGVFCAIATVMTLGNMMFRAVDQCTAPRLAQYLATGQPKRFWCLLGAVIGFVAASGIVLAAASWVFGPSLLGVLFKHEYAAYGNVLTCLVGALTIGLIASAVYSAMIASRLIVIQIPLQLVTIGSHRRHKLSPCSAHGDVGRCVGDVR